MTIGLYDRGAAWRIRRSVDCVGTAQVHAAIIGTVNPLAAVPTAWPIAGPRSVGSGAPPPKSRPTPVTRTLPPFSRLLRASFLVLLLIGLVSRPAPELGCDLLAGEHGATEASASAQGQAPCDGDAPQGDHAHAKGAHTLMHHCFAGASVDASAAPFVLADLRESPVPTLGCVPVSRMQHAVPFRPPIA